MLAKEGLIRRTHGGAEFIGNESDNKIPFTVRALEDYNAKIAMAQKAAALVKDDFVIMLDGSSSAYNVIPFLKDKKNLTVITNGVKAIDLLEKTDIKTICTGGYFLPPLKTLVGQDAIDLLDKYNADIAFFSCRGLTEDGKASDFSIEENAVRQKMIKQSRIKVLLCAKKKFGKKYVHNLCDVKTIDYCISE